MAVTLEPLPPARAIAAVQAQSVGARRSFDWRDTWQDEHARAFVVAKAMKRDVLEAIHGELVKALSEGTTLEQFTRTLRPRLEALGWWGKQSVLDPVTGETRLAQLGSPRRLRTIFNANMRTAYAAGRWEMFERQKAERPFLRYVAVRDERTREQHARWGRVIVLPVDHPFWDTYAPPNGWNCRCGTRSLSARDLERYGLKPTTERELTQAGYGQTRPWLNTRTGETVQVPIGVDPGWAHNPGRDRARALTPGPDDAPPGGAPGAGPRPGPMPPPRPAPADRLLPEGVSEQAAVEAFVREFPEPVFFARTQTPLAIGRRMFQRDDGRTKLTASVRREHLLLLADTLKDPDEIWSEVVPGPGGESRLKLRFVARWRIAGAPAAGVVVFEDMGDVWRGASAFPAQAGRRADAQDRYLERNARVGQLIWRRHG